MTAREPLQIVELAMDYCSRTYASAPCAAVLGTTGERKCFNTLHTCQDTANYDETGLTLRFRMNTGAEPSDGGLIFPALVSVSTNPTKLNPLGVDSDMSALGKRARVTIKLRDFTYHDRGVDKYADERVTGAAQSSGTGYDVAGQGTFWGRLLARQPYWSGRLVTVRQGYAGDALASMRTRVYVVERIDGPDAAGMVTITAKDMLALAEDEKAVAPAVSPGALAEDIDDAQTSATLAPSGIGDSDYPSGGTAIIGSEIVYFTRSGDSLTITRAQEGTEAASHSEGDTFQVCYSATGTINDVVADLLTNYAGVDASYVPNASNWTGAVRRWMSGFDLDGLVPKPTGVSKLLGEICQLGVYIWWDEVDQEIKLRPNRPLDLGETANTVSDDSTIIARTLDNTALHKQRLTQVHVYSGVIDRARSVTDGENFVRLDAAVDLDAESSEQYNESKIYTIRTRWFGRAGNSSIAGVIGQRLLNRYGATPREIRFECNIKDIDSLKVAQPVSVTSRVVQNTIGEAAATTGIVTSAEEHKPSQRAKITVQTYDFGKRYGFVTENGRGDYGASSAAEIEKGTYFVGGTATFSDGTGPYLFF